MPSGRGVGDLGGISMVLFSWKCPKVRAEESVQLILDDGEEVLQGRIDVLVLQNQFWVVVLESKKTALSVWAALPQTLAYLMANPQPEQPSFAMMTNGDEIVFVKLTQIKQRQYDVSRVFAPFSSNRELYSVWQILKSISRVIGHRVRGVWEEEN